MWVVNTSKKKHISDTIRRIYNDERKSVSFNIKTVVNVLCMSFARRANRDLRTENRIIYCILRIVNSRRVRHLKGSNLYYKLNRSSL